ncbi:MAG TPA: hypothetical protein VF065_18470, partial [Ilumatobacter sp.]
MSWTDADFAAMFAAVRHRGPDDSGEYLEGPLRLGMHRLHLRGPEAHLPVTLQGHVAAFNGQIYDAPDLAAEIYSARAGGADGMYACATTGTDGRSASLVTDEYFIKPLFFAEANGDFAFSSEFRALADLRPWTVDREALVDLFAFG